jgi:predicted DNA-binding transcriptional regulator YafY
MEGNSYQNRRRKIIEDCLRNPYRRFTKKKILQELNDKLINDHDQKPVSTRTFEDDWKFIKEALECDGLELLTMREGTEFYYKYSDPEFSIFDNLKKTEIRKLADAIKLLEQIKGIGLDDELMDILQKLDTQLKYYRNKHKNVISFQQNVASNGHEHIRGLYDAITEESAVEFLYRPYEKTAERKIVHPYYLKQYNNRWYLFGCKDGWNSVSCFALDRIQPVIKKVAVPFLPSDGIFNPCEYFKNIIGVTIYPAAPLEEIILQFSSYRAPYVLTKPLHESQQLLQTLKDGSIKISLHLIRNLELEDLILGFGKDVTVLQPKPFAEEIKEKAREIWEKY